METEEFLYESAIIIKTGELVYFRKYRTSTGRILIREVTFVDGKMASTRDFFEHKEITDVEDV